MILPGGTGAQVPFFSIKFFSHVQLYPPVAAIDVHFPFPPHGFVRHGSLSKYNVRKH